MPPANDLPSASVALAAGLCMIALFLGLRQWYEWKAREPDLSKADQVYYSRQDIRRGLGVAVMVIIAALVLLGSRLEPKVQGKFNLLFLQLWVGVLALIIVLLSLALADWTATHSFARRHRREILRESIEAIRREAREVADDELQDELDDPDDLLGE
jgi:hypothetical protein